MRPFGFSAWNEPLLFRAFEHFGSRSLETRSRRLETRSRRLVDLRERAADWHGLREGDLVSPGEFQSRRLPNGLWRSGHRGRILSIR
jgi:hypothetical protein